MGEVSWYAKEKKCPGRCTQDHASDHQDGQADQRLSCLCTIYSASEKFLDILLVTGCSHSESSLLNEKKKEILSVTVVTKDEREALNRSRQPVQERRDPAEVQRNICFWSFKKVWVCSREHLYYNSSKLELSSNLVVCCNCTADYVV